MGCSIAMTMPGTVRFPLPGNLGRERSVVRWYAEIGCSLEYEKMGGLTGEVWDALDSGRACSDHTDFPARKVDVLRGPVSGMINFAPECIDALVIWDLCGGETTSCHYTKTCRYAVTAISLNGPAFRRFVERRGNHSRIKLNVPSQIKAVRDVI